MVQSINSRVYVIEDEKERTRRLIRRPRQNNAAEPFPWQPGVRSQRLFQQPVESTNRYHGVLMEFYLAVVPNFNLIDEVECR